ncbi:hypothetical protein [Calditerricola satsumensis]|uniref:hypothetical protein n=1 Tax=Calditerricola satsumensis TaxID=373054 RepID=UPI001E5362FE|nr:hypothetical protein [Calditerricola satsumensis]
MMKLTLSPWKAFHPLSKSKLRANGVFPRERAQDKGEAQQLFPTRYTCCATAVRQADKSLPVGDLHTKTRFPLFGKRVGSRNMRRQPRQWAIFSTPHHLIFTEHPKGP